MVKRSKRYTQTLEKIDVGKEYSSTDAVIKVKDNASAKFDETVELHLKTSADSTQANQLIRGVVVLPHGIGKTPVVAVFVEGESVTIANESGADFVGGDDLIKKVESGWTEFDVSIATSDMMARVSRLGKILGRKGLMPNPKTGTVVRPDGLSKAIKSSKMGRVEYKLDKNSIIHVVIGKASFEVQQLEDNFNALMDGILRARPSGIKGDLIKSGYLTSTMGPSFALEVVALSQVKTEI
jgi:large subunit ribosomal protein L1